MFLPFTSDDYLVEYLAFHVEAFQSVASEVRENQCKYQLCIVFQQI